MPTFLHLQWPNPASILTLRQLTMLLTPSFSPEGSNRKKFETEVYSLFVKYLREAASKFNNNMSCITGAITLDLRNGERAACGYRVIYARGRLLSTKEA